jgi:hypothetical protein
VHFSGNGGTAKTIEQPAGMLNAGVWYHHSGIGGRGSQCTRPLPDRAGLIGVPVVIRQIIAFLCLALVPASAASEGLNLSWDDCGGSGSSAKSFACDTNDGQDLLVASIQIPSTMDSIFAFQAEIFTRTDLELPNWWRFNSPTTADICCPNPFCRDASVADVLIEPQTTHCTVPLIADSDPPLDQSTFWWLDQLNNPDGNSQRFFVNVALSGSHARAILPADEHYLFSFVIRHVATIGAGSCAGCDVPTCIALRKVTLFRDYVGHAVPVDGPLNRNFVTWQSLINDCAMITPVRKSTWGRIRSLYK